MSRLRRIDVQPDGSLPGLKVPGIHGQVHAEFTPARREPVFLWEGRIARIVPSVRGARRIEVEFADKLFSGDLVEGFTRVGPWEPARLGWIVAATGASERALQLPQPSSDLVDDRSREEGLVYRYCSTEHADALWRVVQEAAVRSLAVALASGVAAAITKAAWWLSRAATSPDDDFLALAALERAGVPDLEGVFGTMVCTTRAEEAYRKELARLELARLEERGRRADHAIKEAL